MSAQPNGNGGLPLGDPKAHSRRWTTTVLCVVCTVAALALVVLAVETIGGESGPGTEVSSHSRLSNQPTTATGGEAQPDLYASAHDPAASARKVIQCDTHEWVRVNFTQFNFPSRSVVPDGLLRVVAGARARHGAIPSSENLTFDHSGDRVVLAMTDAGILIDSSDGSTALRYRVLPGVPIEITSDRVVIQTYGGGLSYHLLRVLEATDFECFPPPGELGVCAIGTVRRVAWLDPLRDVGIHADELPTISSALHAACQLCEGPEELVKKVCNGESGCAPGATGGLCETCVCDTIDYTKCYAAGSAGCEECWGDTQWIETLLTAVFLLGVCVVAPAAIWVMSAYKKKKIHNQVKQRDVGKKAYEAYGAYEAYEAHAARESLANSTPVAETAASISAPALQTAQTVTSLLAHLQICSLAFEVDMNWPQSVRNVAERVRNIAFFDYMSFLQQVSVCHQWRDSKASAARCTQGVCQLADRIDMQIEGGCQSDADCRSTTMLGDVSAWAADPNNFAGHKTLLRVATSFSVFVVIVAVFALLIYVPARCLPATCLTRFGSSPKEVRRHCVNALAASHSLLLMLLCKSCFALIDVHERNSTVSSVDTVYYMAYFPDVSSEEHDGQYLFFLVWIGWMATVWLVVCPPLVFLKKIRNADRMVANWEAIDRKQEFSKLLLDLTAATARDGGASSTGLEPESIYNEDKLRELNVDELRKLCEDEQMIEQDLIDAADRDAVIVVCTERWSEDFQRSYGFVYLRYDPWAWWYEAVATTRKVLLVAFTILLSESQVAFTLTSMATVIMALQVQLKNKPFVGGEHMFIDTPVVSHVHKTEDPNDKGCVTKLDARTCKSVGTIIVGAILGIAVGFILPIRFIDDRDDELPNIFFTGLLGPILYCVFATAALIGLYCWYKLASLCCYCCYKLVSLCYYYCCRCRAPPQSAAYQVVIDEQVIHVGNVPVLLNMDCDAATVTSAPVVWRRHNHEDTHGGESNADPADTLEQAALVSMFVMLLMGLTTYAVNIIATDGHKPPSPTTSSSYGHDGRADRETPATAIDVLSWMCGMIALAAAIMPFIATYWFYKDPADTRIAKMLKPVSFWLLAPLDWAHQKLKASMARRSSSKKLPSEGGSGQSGCLEVQVAPMPSQPIHWTHVP